MKQDASTTEKNKASSPLQRSPAPVTRARFFRTKDSPRFESPNEASHLSPGSKTRPKHLPSESNSTQRARKSIFSKKPKEGEMEDSKIANRPRNRTVEQYAGYQQRMDTGHKGLEYETDAKAKYDLQRRLDDRESLVKELQSEVSVLKDQLEKMKSLNVVLESQNKHLAKDLLDAEAKIIALKKPDQAVLINKEMQPSEFRNVRELIGNKLELVHARRVVTKEEQTTKVQPSALEQEAIHGVVHPKVQLAAPPPLPPRPAPIIGTPPPPPPPPPPRRAPLRANTMQNATSLVQFYHSLTKRDEKCASPIANKAHNSIVGELQNRSAHLLAIKADVEKKGNFINNLIQRVQSTAFTDMEDVLNFVGWLDGQLSVLADERAVLKHFNWPERKADALREAAFEYRDLKRLQYEILSFEDDASIPCEATLKKIATLLDKEKHSKIDQVKGHNHCLL